MTCQRNTHHFTGTPRGTINKHGPEAIRPYLARMEDLTHVFVQVNASGEETKAGVQPDDALQFALDVAALPSLHVRGLMTIGANSPDPAVVNAAFAVMQELSSTVGRSGLDAPELSMGMSSDLEAAIAHGATMVRLGTDIFGPRV